MDLKSSEPVSQQPNNSRSRIIVEFIPTIVFIYISYDFALSPYRSRINLWDLAFIISCFIHLLLLFIALEKHKNLTADAPTEYRDRLTSVVWILCTLIICTFAWQMSQFMPWYLNIIIWAVSAAIIVVGFYTCEDAPLANQFCKLDSNDKEENELSKLSP